jgi:molecular chaperone GrpE
MGKETVEESEFEKQLNKNSKNENPIDDVEDDLADEIPSDMPEGEEDSQESEPALKEKSDMTFTLELLSKEMEGLRDQLLRSRADFDNYRKRMAREQERIRKTAAEKLIQDVLPILDHLELALQHIEDETDGLAQGVSMVHKQFSDVLQGHGLTPIEAAGKPFDPNFHEALQQVPHEEIEADHVAQEFQKGYLLGETVIRPTKVIVSTGPKDSDEDK